MPGIHIVEIVKTCDSCPAQWDAKDSEGRMHYIRYRHGWLTVQRAPPDEPLNAHADKALLLVKKQVGDEFGGCMDEDELAKHTKRILRFGDEPEEEEDAIDPEIVGLIQSCGLTKEEILHAIRMKVSDKAYKAPRPWPEGEPF